MLCVRRRIRLTVVLRYPLSKLILLFAIREFAARHPVSSTGVVVNYVNPGLCVSELTRYMNENVQKQIHQLRDAVGRTTEAGSRTLVHGAIAGESSHGKYLSELVTKEYVPSLWSFLSLLTYNFSPQALPPRVHYRGKEITRSRVAKPLRTSE